MKLHANNQGMTLLEVLAAVAISLISMTVLMQLTLSNRTHKSGIDRAIVFKEVLTNNAIELKGASVDDIPLPITSVAMLVTICCKVLAWADKRTFRAKAVWI
ncbi:type II secretion system GspH family protein [Bdellovibrio bacteriovorus]|uniref:type II secretion system protein n=1 Tax=Bdellovibrio bacteriovorus TaxID=959 RepID=UPI0021D01527|nr:type II secretion system protein [Bdellovibrio bacteriovorus]UXR65773.1 type II secretion system GspH family protein [Bdellovibrio bacteriovorus]